MTINLIDHPIMFQVPDLEAPSEWVEHIPFAMLLVDLIRPRSIVELGVFAGVSYCAFCQAVKQLQITTKCYAVDTWQGDEHGGSFGNEVRDKLRDYHDPRYGSFSQLIQSTFDDAAPSFAEGSIDLLHIDGYHTYDAVSHDFATWLPKMSDSGIILLHDIAERRADFGVWRFWGEISRQYPSFEFEHGHGLGVAIVGKTIPEGLRQLLDCTDAQRDTFRTMCYERGVQLRSLQRKAIEEQADTADSGAKADEAQQARLAVLDRTLAERERTIEQLRQREQNSIARERKNRSTYEDQILTLEERIQALNGELAWVHLSRGVRAVRRLHILRHHLFGQGPIHAVGRGVKAIGSGGRARKSKRVRHVKATSAQREVIRAQHLPESQQFSGVSVVIPVFNALDYAQKCVASIYNAESQIPYEIIVVDNGSNKNVVDWLRNEAKKHDNFWYVSVSSNMGYARGINLGIKHARGQYLMLSNSDILATSNWLDLMVETMERDQSIAVLSPLTNYVGQGPQIDHLAKNIGPEAREEHAAMIKHTPEVQVVTNGLVFFCVMVRRQVTTLLGGLSEEYGLGNYEDDDFCIRVRMAGYKLAIARNAFVYHFGTKTFSANKIDHSGYMHRNLIHYLDRVSVMSTSLSPTTPRRSISEPLISVVVRTVNRPQTLTLALTSLANQTWESFEAVVVCDGGPDMRSVLEPFTTYFKIRYVHNDQPQGRSEALNTGVKHCEGRYVTYLDDDDIVYPTHLETLANAVLGGAEGKTFAYVDYNRALMGSDGGGLATVSRVPVATWPFNYNNLLAQNFLPIHSWLHDRELWEELGGFRTHMDMLEDWDFLIRAAERRKFVSAGRITCEYRFYLNGSNSLVLNRPKAIDATEDIFDRYPANSAVDTERHEVLLALREQSNRITRALESSSVNGKTPEHVMRRLLAELAGFVQ